MSSERESKTQNRDRLLLILARLDQLAAEAEAILAEPVYADVGAMAEELGQLVADMRAKVEARLNQQTKD